MKKLFLLSVLIANILSPAFAQSTLDETVANVPNEQLVLTSFYLAPTPKRSGRVFGNQDIRQVLSPSVRITNGNSMGSGTICYYDPSTRWAYIISCGHLFNGDSMEPGQGSHTCQIEVFYKGRIKQNPPAKYRAEVICWSKRPDISFLRFKPDYQPTYIPIAPESYPIKMGSVLESVGCDHGSETAAYTVVVNRVPKGQSTLQTNNNSALPGRSGGSVISEDGWYLGIVVTVDGFNDFANMQCTSLQAIHGYASQRKKIAFLLRVGKQSMLANRLPIVGENGKALKLKNYIPMP